MAIYYFDFIGRMELSTMIRSEKMQEATPYLMKQWLPFNEDLLQELQIEIRAKGPNFDRRTILKKIKCDPALYTYCLYLGDNPLESRTAGGLRVADQVCSGLIKLCSNKGDRQRTHRLKDSSTLQTRILRSTVTKTAASSTLAHYFNVDSELAYAVHSLREVGLALIAWNYPKIYAEAVELCRLGQTPVDDETKAIDQRLIRILGFSPLHLAINLATSIRLPNEIMIGLGESVAQLNASAEELLVGATLRKITEISEIFTAATSPDASARSITKWDLYREELTPVLGITGLLKLKECCATALAHYAKTLPEIVKQPITDSLYRSANKRPNRQYLQNLHIIHCNSEVSNLLQNLYAKINPTVIAYEHVTELVKRIAPKAGFASGGIYLVNPSSYSLEPRLIVGEPKLSPDKIFFRQPQYQNNPICQAFLAKLPVNEHYNDSHLLSIAGIMGFVQRVGVLYLEPSETINGEHSPALRAHFKALQQALNDCLNLL